MHVSSINFYDSTGANVNKDDWLPQGIVKYIGDSSHSGSESHTYASEAQACLSVDKTKTLGSSYLRIEIVSGSTIQPTTLPITPKDKADTINTAYTLMISTTLSQTKTNGIISQDEIKGTQFIIDDTRSSSTSTLVFNPSGAGIALSYFAILLTKDIPLVSIKQSSAEDNEWIKGSFSVSSMFITSNPSLLSDDLDTVPERTKPLLELEGGSIFISSCIFTDFNIPQSLITSRRGMRLSISSNDFTNIHSQSGDGAIFDISLTSLSQADDTKSIVVEKDEESDTYRFSLDLSGCTFIACTTAGNGGVIAATVKGAATFTICGGSFKKCEAAKGGAIYINCIDVTDEEGNTLNTLPEKGIKFSGLAFGTGDDS